MGTTFISFVTFSNIINHLHIFPQNILRWKHNTPHCRYVMIQQSHFIWITNLTKCRDAHHIKCSVCWSNVGIIIAVFVGYISEFLHWQIVNHRLLILSLASPRWSAWSSNLLRLWPTSGSSCRISLGSSVQHLTDLSRSYTFVEYKYTRYNWFYSVFKINCIWPLLPFPKIWLYFY